MEKISNWFRKPVLSLVFYAFALVTLIYAAYMFFNTYEYIGSLVEAGSVTWADNFADIFNYFISSTANFLFYGLSFVFFGHVVAKLSPKAPAVETVEEVVEEIVEEQPTETENVM